MEEKVKTGQRRHMIMEQLKVIKKKLAGPAEYMAGGSVNEAKSPPCVVEEKEEGEHEESCKSFTRCGQEKRLLVADGHVCPRSAGPRPSPYPE